jgi:hypothetical protein
MALEEGRFEDALSAFREAVASGQDPTVPARLLFNDAVGNGIRYENWEHALRGLVAAKTFAVQDTLRADLDFWHGYTLYNQAMQVQRPQTLDAARRARPLFDRANELFESARRMVPNRFPPMERVDPLPPRDPGKT